jgi:hypothetical protein
MKYYILLTTTFVSLLSFSSLNAQESSIASLLEKVKQSSTSQRRVAINQLKVALRKMSRGRREKIMLQLQSSLRKKPLYISSKDRDNRSCRRRKRRALGDTNSISSRVRTSPIKTTHREGK